MINHCNHQMEAPTKEYTNTWSAISSIDTLGGSPLGFTEGVLLVTTYNIFIVCIFEDKIISVAYLCFFRLFPWC